MADDEDDDALGKAFLTGIDVRHKEPEQRLDNVRRDHSKLMSVVSALRGKVEFMIDRQRTDFMTAYEHHIQDVVKEINYLREKVNEVANDKARQEKMDDLDKQQNAFKNEALALDADTITLKKTLRILTGKIHSLEQDRDWILKRLRLCKDKFNRLRDERIRRVGCDSSTLDNDSSSYMIELNRDRDRDDANSVGAESSLSGGHFEYSEANFGNTKYLSKSTNNLFNSRQNKPSEREMKEKQKNQELAQKKSLQMNQTFAVSRDQGLLPGQNQAKEQHKKPVRLERLGSKQNMMLPIEVGPSTGKLNVYVPEITSDIPHTEYTNTSAKARGKLVDLRTRQESIRDFVAQCSIALGKGPWAKISPRPLDELIEKCTIVVMDPSDRDEERQRLAVELAGSIETYYALSDLMSGKYDHMNFRFGSQYEQENNLDIPFDIMVNSGNDNKEAVHNYFSDWGGLEEVNESYNRQGVDEYYDAENARDLAFGDGGSHFNNNSYKNNSSTMKAGGLVGMTQGLVKAKAASTSAL